MPNLVLIGAREGNLQDISLEIPKNKLVVFTGVSGSGKSTLAMDVIFQECQRQYLEAIGMQGIRKPKLTQIRGASPAVCIAQTDSNRNPRSTVGTRTDVYTDLRMLYEKLAVRVCPHCEKPVSAARCREETEKRGEDFLVWMYCEHCGVRMPKLTRSHFSHNTREGACPGCQGLGNKLAVNLQAAVREDKSLEEGAVSFWEKRYGEYQAGIYEQALRHFGFPSATGTLIGELSALQKAILYYGVECEEVKAAYPNQGLPKTVTQGRFEGVVPNLWRRVAEKEGDLKLKEIYFHSAPCPECHGERLNALSRSAQVHGTRLPELTKLSLEELLLWLEELTNKLSPEEHKLIEDYLLDLKTKLRRIVNIGLSYLNLDRQSLTLSGGEAQRLRLSAALDSDLTGLIYLLDEPTAGLHPQDTEGLIHILKELRDLGNTVLVIEHDPDVMREADYLIDLGPGAGKHGGRIVGTGTFKELISQPDSVTGAYFRDPPPLPTARRKGTGEKLSIRRASLYNLDRVDADIPAGCLTVVTGVSGSGKSTLIFDILSHAAQQGTSPFATITGLDSFSGVVSIGQSPISKMKRSNVATYTGAYTEIRTLFGATEDAKRLGLTAGNFSFNSKGGRCENCQGLGTVTSNLLFFEDQEIICPVCGGRRFTNQVLEARYQGYAINDVLKMSVEEALRLFSSHKKLSKILGFLTETGLGYLELGQILTTLSGGECQRLKLAAELLQGGEKVLYLMDEPTVGLHPLDVEHFLRLLSRMVDAGGTVVVAEHNQQVIQAADHILELGPGGGVHGGKLLFQGTPEDIVHCKTSITGSYLLHSGTTNILH